ncbi:MAG: gliding motility-associated C-terminal domain-containing protein [Bacteroidota bacterium]|nr:gliding motility-associated C-terminal domain-containing protein [Bacteroidota bacterium]
MKKLGFLFFYIFSFEIFAQTYTVNSSNDLNDGVCDGFHCSLREAVLAAEADGLPSTILFNILGVGPHIIIPSGPFPNVTQPDLNILGESQVGGLGSIIIDFAYRDFVSNSFWRILAPRFSISGIGFRHFQFVNNVDHIFEIGNTVVSADNAKIYNCAFYEDNFIVASVATIAILVYQSDNLLIRKNIFGADFTKSSITTTYGYVGILSDQNLQFTEIDSNIFVTKKYCINADGGTCLIEDNIFGALDTSKSINFLDPDSGVQVYGSGIYTIQNNFFFGQKAFSIFTNALDKNLLIHSNDFHNSDVAIELDDVSIANYRISNNLAKNGGDFLRVRLRGSYYLDAISNIVDNHRNFYTNNLISPMRKARYLDNRMTCIFGEVTDLVNAGFAPPPVPVIIAVNRNRIVGTGTPNDSVIVYYNPRAGCPVANCKGGIELGRTRSDVGGNWSLNIAYPNRSTISAYQYISNGLIEPSVYSEFSECYTCPGEVKQFINGSICSGETFTFRGKVYDQNKLVDSFGLRGDGVSICDSVFVVNVNLSIATRRTIEVPICFNDTFFIANKQIHKFHTLDSLLLQSQAGCDSTIILNGTERGLFTLQQTLCSNDQLQIGSQIFDKNNPNGIVVLPGQSVFGCDSVIFVDLVFKSFAESDFKPVLCPGQNVRVGTKVFDVSFTADTVILRGASSTGCDSIINVSISFANINGSISVTICAGDSVLIEGQYFSDRNPNGQIILPLRSFYNCDSVLNVSLTILPSAMGIYRQDICRDDTLTLHGQKFYNGKISGNIRLANSSQIGCDSVVQVDLSIIPDAIGQFDTAICENETLTLYGTVFSMIKPNGSVRIKDATYRMCDSFLMVRVTFIGEQTGIFSPTICLKDSIRVNNTFYSARNSAGLERLVRGSAAGCDSVIDVRLNFYLPLSVQFGTQPLMCNSANTGSLNIGNISGGSGTFQISIDNAVALNFSPGLSISTLSLGNHTFRIIDAQGCDSVVNFSIQNSAGLNVQLPNDTTIFRGNSVFINPTINFTPALITWTPSTELSCPNCLNTVASPNNTVTYTLTIEDDFGCQTTDRMTITVLVDESDIFVPNVFSPNGDNVNDLFLAKFKFPDRTKILVFRIYDRWGELMHESLDGAIGQEFTWNGYFRDKPLNPGVFVYTILYQAEEETPKWKNGDVTILK